MQTGWTAAWWATEDHKRRLFTGSAPGRPPGPPPQPPALGSPRGGAGERGTGRHTLARSAPPRRPQSGPRRLVVVSAREGDVSCPQCGTAASALGLKSVEDFQGHVLRCRISNGGEPGLPCIAIAPSPPRSVTGSPPRPVPGRSARGRPLASLSIDLSDGVAHPTLRRSGSSCSSPTTTAAVSPTSAFRTDLVPPPLVETLLPPAGHVPRRRRAPGSAGGPLERQGRAAVAALQSLLLLQESRPSSAGAPPSAAVADALLECAETGVLDLGGTVLRVEDTGAVAAVVAHQQGLRSLSFGGFERPGVARAIVAAVAQSQSIVEITVEGVPADACSSPAAASRTGAAAGSDAPTAAGSSSSCAATRECIAELGRLGRASREAELRRERAEAALRMRCGYAEWRQQRHQARLDVTAEEARLRTDVARAAQRERRELWLQQQQTRTHLQRKAKVLRARHFRFRRRMEHLVEEQELRAELEFLALGDLMWIVVQQEVVVRACIRAREVELRETVRRRGAQGLQYAIQRTLERKERERLQRQQLEGDEVEARNSLEEHLSVIVCHLEDDFEEECARILWYEEQRYAREALRGAERSERQQKVREEEEARDWVYNRIADVIARKQAAQLRQREAVLLEEERGRVSLEETYEEWVPLMEEEMAAHYAWSAKRTQHQQTEQQRLELVRQLPELELRDGLSFESKPFVYFVRTQDRERDCPPVWVNTTATFSATLSSDWAVQHKETVTHLRMQQRESQELGDRARQVAQRNMEVYVELGLCEPAAAAGQELGDAGAWFTDVASGEELRSPISEPIGPHESSSRTRRGKVGGRRARGGTVDASGGETTRSRAPSVAGSEAPDDSSIPVAASTSSGRRPRRVSPSMGLGGKKGSHARRSRTMLSSEQLLAEKQKIWGGHVEFRMLPPADEQLEFVVLSDRLGCQTYLDLEVNGRHVAGSGVPADMPAEHPVHQFQLPEHPAVYYQQQQQDAAPAASRQPSQAAALLDCGRQPSLVPPPQDGASPVSRKHSHAPSELLDADGGMPPPQTSSASIGSPVNPGGGSQQSSSFTDRSASGDGIAAVTAGGASRTYHIPPGGTLRVMLPQYEPDEVDPGLIQRVVRSCVFQSTARGIREPHVRRIECTVWLQYAQPLPLHIPDSVEGLLPMPDSLADTSATVVMEVVCALPFLALSRQPPITFLEGMKADQTPIIPEQLVFNDPPSMTRREGEGFTVMAGGNYYGVALSNFHDSYIVIDIVQGWSSDDRLLFRNTSKLWTTPQGVISMRAKDGRDVRVAKVISGVLPPCSDDPSTLPEAQPWAVIHLHNENHLTLLTAEGVHSILKAIRFCNFSLTPTEGIRRLQITLADRNRYAASVTQDIKVVGEDNPTELTIPNQRLIVRPSNTPAAFRKYISAAVIPIAEGATVVDVDTDRFAGGSLRVTISGSMGKGEGLALCLSSKALSGFLRQAIDRTHLHAVQQETAEGLTMGEDDEEGEGDIAKDYHHQALVAAALDADIDDEESNVLVHEEGTLIFEGRVIGRVAKGAVFGGEARPDCVDAGSEILIEFSKDGMMSIAACQTLLRHLVLLHSTVKTFSGLRNIELTLQVGPTVVGKPEEDPDAEVPEVPDEFECVLTERITVRGAPALMNVPEKHTLVEYREGSGHSRLAPFELLQDKPAFVENYNDGYIMVEIVEGNTDDDVLGLRDEDPIKVVPHSASPPKVQSAVSEQGQQRSPAQWQRASRALRTAAALSEMRAGPSGRSPSAVTSTSVMGPRVVTQILSDAEPGDEENVFRRVHLTPEEQERACRAAHGAFADGGEGPAQIPGSIGMGSLITSEVTAEGFAADGVTASGNVPPPDLLLPPDLKVARSEDAAADTSEGEAALSPPPAAAGPPTGSTPETDSVASPSSGRHRPSTVALRERSRQVDQSRRKSSKALGFAALLCSPTSPATPGATGASLLAPTPVGRRAAAFSSVCRRVSRSPGSISAQMDVHCQVEAAPKTRLIHLREVVRDHLGKGAEAEEPTGEGRRRATQFRFLQSQVRSIVRERMKTKERDPGFVADIFLHSGDRPIATLRKVGGSVLHIQFKGDQVTVMRKHVLTILKNLTYKNQSSDPQVLRKIVRVTLSDRHPAFCQSVIELKVETVDDVTEICLLNQKVRHIASDSEHPLVLCPFGQAKLHDEDTEWFDGGYLSFTTVAGDAKGYSLGILTPEQQDAIADSLPANLLVPGPLSTGALYRVGLDADGKRLWNMQGDGGEDVHCANVKWEDDRKDLRITFCKQPEQELVHLSLASYILNCIMLSYDGAPMGRKSTTRTYQIRIRDASESAQEGKQKLQIECYPPILVFQPWTYQSEAVCNVALGEQVSVFDGPKWKLLLAVPRHDKEPITSGSIIIALDPPEGIEADDTLGLSDSLLLNHAAGSFTLKDGGLVSQGPTPVARVEQQQQQLRLRFDTSLKGVNRQVQALLRCIQFRRKGAFQFPRQRVCRARFIPEDPRDGAGHCSVVIKCVNEPQVQAEPELAASTVASPKSTLRPRRMAPSASSAALTPPPQSLPAPAD